MSSVNYTAPPTVARFLKSDAPVRLILGPYGSGKSTGCIMEIFRRAASMPQDNSGVRRSRWIVIRNTRQQLKTSTWKSWIQWFPDGVFGTWRESEMTFYLRVGDINAEVLFLPLDTPDDQRRLLSLEATGAWINEARELPLEIVVAIRGRLGRYPSKAMLPASSGGKYWSGLFMDSNFPSEDHWIHEKFEVEQPEGWEVYKQPGGLDPGAENRENLPPTYYEDMLAGATDDWARAHVHSQYSRSMLGRAVYEGSFKPEFHIAEKPLEHVRDQNYPLCIGMDFGRTPSAVMLQRDARGRVLVLSECDADNMGLENFLQRVLKPHLANHFPGMPTYVVGDPAGWAKSQINEQHVGDILKANGFMAVRAPTNDPDKRIAAVERLLALQYDGKAMLLVSPTCRKLIRGFKGAYRYKRKTDGTYEPRPDKGPDSHLADAMQYGCLGIDGSVASRVQAYGQAREIEAVSAVGWT